MSLTPEDLDAIDRLIATRFEALNTVIKAIAESQNRASADESRETSRSLGRIEGKIEPLRGQIGGLDRRLGVIEKSLRHLDGKAGTIIQQGATVRKRLIPGEIPAVAPAPDNEAKPTRPRGTVDATKED